MFGLAFINGQSWIFGPASITGDLTVTGNLSTTGNLGVGSGTTLSSFDTTYSASQVTGSLSLLGDNAAALFGNNIYYNGGWKYAKSLYASIYVQNNAGAGDHAWYTAPSGTAGNAITLTQAMTLKNGGNLLLGGTADGGQKLQVAGVVNSSGAGYTNSGYQLTNTSASRTTGWFMSNAATTILRDVTGEFDLFSVDTSGNATFAGNVYGTGNLVLLGGSATNANIYLRAQGTGYVRVDTGSGFRVETGKVAMTSLPTSSTGLSSGDLWIDTSAGRVIKVVA